MLALTLFAAPGLRAQGVQGIAAIVNDEVVSIYDLDQRTRLLITTTGQQPTDEQIRRLQPQILQSLISESLQIQEARRLSIDVSEVELSRAIDSIERQNNLNSGDLERILVAAGTDLDALKKQLRAQISWDKVVVLRLRPTVFVGQDEIDAVLERINSRQGEVENLVSEIFVPVDDINQRDDVRRNTRYKPIFRL